RDLVIVRDCGWGQNQRVERRRALAFWPDQQRIDVDARELPLLRRDKHRELRQSDGERVDVAGRLAARPFEDRGAAQLADHVVRFLDSERRDAESDIAQYLDKDAA